MNPPRLILLSAVFVLIASQAGLRADPSAAIADLENRIHKASDQHDLNAIKDCYDFSGASAFQMDQSISMWQSYWNQGDPATNWSFDTIEYASLEQLRQSKAVPLRSIQGMCQPQKMGEHLYAPNLKVIGIMSVYFKDTKGSRVGSMQPIGIDSNGAARIVSLVPTP